MGAVMHAHVGRAHLGTPLRPRQLELLRALVASGRAGISHREIGELVGMNWGQVERVLEVLGARRLVELSIGGLYVGTTALGLEVAK